MTDVRVLVCRECGRRQALDVEQDLDDTAWEDIEVEGEFDQKTRVIAHEATCPEHDADSDENHPETDETPEETGDGDDTDGGNVPVETGSSVEETVTVSSWEPRTDSVVEIARADLPSTPSHEHERGIVEVVDVDVPAEYVAVEQQKRRRRGLDAVLGELFGQRRDGNEVCVYANPDEHAGTTYYQVAFQNGARGIYPRASLVPAPEEVFQS